MRTITARRRTWSRNHPSPASLPRPVVAALVAGLSRRRGRGGSGRVEHRLVSLLARRHPLGLVPAMRRAVALPMLGPQALEEHRGDLAPVRLAMLAPVLDCAPDRLALRAPVPDALEEPSVVEELVERNHARKRNLDPDAGVTQEPRFARGLHAGEELRLELRAQLLTFARPARVRAIVRGQPLRRVVRAPAATTNESTTPRRLRRVGDVFAAALEHAPPVLVVRAAPVPRRGSGRARAGTAAQAHRRARGPSFPNAGTPSGESECDGGWLVEAEEAHVLEHGLESFIKLAPQPGAVAVLKVVHDPGRARALAHELD